MVSEAVGGGRVHTGSQALLWLAESLSDAKHRAQAGRWFCSDTQDVKLRNTYLEGSQQKACSIHSGSFLVIMVMVYLLMLSGCSVQVVTVITLPLPPPHTISIKEILL